MSLSRIKGGFAILKEIVLEARAGGALASINTSAEGNTHTGSVEQQIQDLRDSLQQRDSEIAILVNMVKKGRSVDDLAPMAARQARDSSAEQSRVVLVAGSLPTRPLAEKALEVSEAKRKADSKRYHLNSLQSRFGVPAPQDGSILEDPQRAFDYFKEFSPLLQAIEENKQARSSMRS
jgi:hypothetical protein